MRTYKLHINTDRLLRAVLSILLFFHVLRLLEFILFFYYDNSTQTHLIRIGWLGMFSWLNLICLLQINKRTLQGLLFCTFFSALFSIFIGSFFFERLFQNTYSFLTFGTLVFFILNSIILFCCLSLLKKKAYVQKT